MVTAARAGKQRARAGQTGLGISLTAHAAIGLVVFGAAAARPTNDVDVGTGETGTIEVGVTDEAPPSPEAAHPAPIQAGLVAAAPRGQGHRPPSPAAAPLRRPQAPVPHINPIRTLTSIHAPTPRLTEGAAPLPASTTALAQTAPAAAKPPGAAGVSEGGPPARPGAAGAAPFAAPFVAPEVASYLRAQDYFPSLPASLRRNGARYQARLDICVAADGHVADVGIRSAPAPALDSVLLAAVRGWRYRPLIINGQPAPFCHRMTLSYEIM